MRVGSLSTGFGGLDIGLEWAGHEIAWQCEIDLKCRQHLEHVWPGVIRYGDMYAIEPEKLPSFDLLCAGLPCQPVSIAGKREGTADDRWLWPAMRGIIAARRPPWVLGENTPGLITLGLDDILFDLESLGYSTWQAVIPACAVEAPHIRERVFVLAHTSCQGWALPHQQRELEQALNLWEGSILERHCRPWRDATWVRGRDGKTRAFKPGIPCVAHGIPGRVAKIKGVGNAVVPQVAYEFGLALRMVHGEAA